MQPHADAASGVQVVAPRELLTDIEQESLRLAISEAFFEQEGWTEGEHGDIVNGKGRRLYGYGYRRAVSVQPTPSCL